MLVNERKTELVTLAALLLRRPLLAGQDAPSRVLGGQSRAGKLIRHGRIAQIRVVARIQSRVALLCK